MISGSDSSCVCGQQEVGRGVEIIIKSLRLRGEGGEKYSFQLLLGVAGVSACQRLLVRGYGGLTAPSPLKELTHHSVAPESDKTVNKSVCETTEGTNQREGTWPEEVCFGWSRQHAR